MLLRQSLCELTAGGAAWGSSWTTEASNCALLEGKSSFFLLESMLWSSEMTPQSLDLTTAFLIFTLFPIFLFLCHQSYGPWRHYVVDCTSMCIHACVCVCIHSEAFTTQFAVDFYSFCSYFSFHVVDSTDFNCVDSAGFF